MKSLKFLSGLTILIFPMLLFVIGTTLAQEKANQFDAQGKRIGAWKKYYDNKRIRYQGQFEAGKEIGVFKYYSEQSSEFPVAIKTFIKNSDLAQVKFYSEKGILESEGEMKGKDHIGKWLYYHKDGKTIMTEENYKNGILEGESKTYYNTGKPTEILPYKSGKLHGNVKRFSDEGILLDDLLYENGKRQGPAKYYNVDGKLIQKGNYENDEKVGKWEYFKNEKSTEETNIKQ